MQKPTKNRHNRVLCLKNTYFSLSKFYRLPESHILI